MKLETRLIHISEALTTSLVILLVLGGILSFGGAVWWFPPVLVVGASGLLVLRLGQGLLRGGMPILRSPLAPLGVLTLGLAAFQLVPLPARFAGSISPTAHEVHARGVLPSLAHRDDPQLVLPAPAEVRSPVTLDRSATLRWFVKALACLIIFTTVSHFTNRLARLYLVWGLVVGGFFLNAAFAVVQVMDRNSGLYGVYAPGHGPSWTPSLDDVLSSPCVSVLQSPRGARSGASTAAVHPPPGVAPVPVLPFTFGTLLGGSGAFLVMGALALPLAIALVLHLLAPRTSYESAFNRLRQSGQGSLVILLVALSLLATVLVGLVGGLLYCLPIALGAVIVIGPACFRPGSRAPALGLLTLVVAGLGAGIVVQGQWPLLFGGQAPVQTPDPKLAQTLWASALEIVREFPIMGAGLGCFPVIHPYFKSISISSTTAMSTLLQFSAEAGFVGVGVMLAAALWCVVRLPAAVRRVSPADRGLAYGLVGALASISLFAAIHWTVELPAVAVSASALGGICDRWLSGGTDLFTECL